MSDLLPASLIAELTTLNETAMPDVVTITTRVQTSDGAGGFTASDVTTTTKGQLVPATGTEAGTDQVAERGTYRLYIPKSVSVSNTGSITVAGRQFAIKWTPPVTGYSTSRVLGLEDLIGSDTAVPSGSTRITRDGRTRVTQTGATRLVA